MNLTIDQQAYCNKLLKIHPAEKMGFTFLTMLITLYFSDPILSLLVASLMSFIIIKLAGISPQIYLNLLLIPMAFLLMSVLVIGLVITGGTQNLLFFVQLGKYAVGVSQASLAQAWEMLSQAIALIISMYFLILTTPMVDILEILRKMKVPAIVTEIMGLIYRLIFVLLDEVGKISTAQKARLGYIDFKKSCSSLAQLASGMLIKGFSRTKLMNQGLMSRCYQGDLAVLALDYYYSKKNILLIILTEIVLIVAGIYLGGL